MGLGVSVVRSEHIDMQRSLLAPLCCKVPQEY